MSHVLRHPARHVAAPLPIAGLPWIGGKPLLAGRLHRGELIRRGGLARTLCEKKAERYSANSYQHCQRYKDATSPHSTLGRRCFHEVKSQLSDFGSICR